MSCDKAPPGTPPAPPDIPPNAPLSSPNTPSIYKFPPKLSPPPVALAPARHSQTVPGTFPPLPPTSSRSTTCGSPPWSPSTALGVTSRAWGGLHSRETHPGPSAHLGQLCLMPGDPHPKKSPAHPRVLLWGGSWGVLWVLGGGLWLPRGCEGGTGKLGVSLREPGGLVGDP